MWVCGVVSGVRVGVGGGGEKRQGVGRCVCVEGGEGREGEWEAGWVRVWEWVGGWVVWGKEGGANIDHQRDEFPPDVM